jgi:hypothetical protein
MVRFHKKFRLISGIIIIIIIKKKNKSGRRVSNTSPEKKVVDYFG